MHEKLNIAVLPIAIGAFIAAMDNNVLNICLPLLVKELKSDLGMAQFVSSSYVFALCSSLLFFAYISSAIGRKYMFGVGMAIFSVGSLAAAFSSSISALIVFRIIQGVGAAMYMANGMALINSHFADNVKERAFAIIFTAASLASIMGPIIGGTAATLWGWRANFLLFTPLGFISALLAVKVMQRESKKAIASFDLKGSLLSIIFVLLFFGGSFFLKSIGGLLPYLLLALSVGFLWLFFKTEKNAANPIIQMGVFPQRVVGANFQAGLIFAIMTAVGVIVSVYVQDGLGCSAAYSGAVLASMALSMVALAYYGGILADKAGPYKVASLGRVLILIGLVGLSCAIYFNLKWLLFLGNAFLGGGIGLFNSANNKLVQICVPKKYFSAAAGINFLSKNAGIAIGSAISGMSYSFFLDLFVLSDAAALLSILVFEVVSALLVFLNLPGDNNTLVVRIHTQRM